MVTMEPPPPPFLVPRDWKLWAVVALGIAGSIGAEAFGANKGIVEIAGDFALVWLVVVFVCRPVWKMPWFWTTMIFLAALHAGAVLEFNWDAAAHWTGLTRWPVMMADIILTITTIKVIYRLTVGKPAQWETAEPLEERYGERDLNL